MGTALLRGISLALLVTILTLLAGMLWTAMGMSGLSLTRLIDVGLLLSCLAGGYRSGKESGLWLVGGLAGAGYVALGAALLALFLPVSGWGAVQVLGEGTLIGLIAGAIGMNYSRPGAKRWAPRNRSFRPAFGGSGLSAVQGGYADHPGRGTTSFGPAGAPDQRRGEQFDFGQRAGEQAQAGDLWTERPAGPTPRQDPLDGVGYALVGSSSSPGRSEAWWEQDIDQEY